MTEKRSSYLKLLEESGFQKHSDNGEGVDTSVFTSSYTKGDSIVTISYLARKDKIITTELKGFSLSEHLLYNDSYKKGIQQGAQTKLYMLELWGFGNSFVFQLKNGHFIISDGGLGCELPYLLDFLESLTPIEERPIVEAWIITHGHPDHYGALTELREHSDWSERIVVEGIYYNAPSQEVAEHCNCAHCYERIRETAVFLGAEFYCPQIGQRYYFCDITMDVVFSQELVPFEDYRGDINNASTVCMFNIEGQKVFLSADIQEEGLLDITEIYSQDYLKLDMFTLNHHGFDTCNTFTDYSSIQTLLITRQDEITPNRTRREMRHLLENVQEFYHYGEGTTVFTFPYQIGSAETLPLMERIYNKGEERMKTARVQYTIPGRRFRGFIFEADNVLFVEDKLQDRVKELLILLKKSDVFVSIYSKKATGDLKKQLQENEIAEYFDAILGRDSLDEEDTYRDALVQSEKVFGLEHIHNILVVCHDMKTVDAALAEGFRTLAVNPYADEELRFKASKGAIDCVGDIFDFFEREQILFENLKSYLRRR